MTSTSPAARPADAPAQPARPGAATLITVAPTGAESDKAAVPALPVTLDELVATAVECRAAGAAVIHVHIRDEARPADPGPGPAEGHRARAARAAPT